MSVLEAFHYNPEDEKALANRALHAWRNKRCGKVCKQSRKESMVMYMPRTLIEISRTRKHLKINCQSPEYLLVA